MPYYHVRTFARILGCALTLHPHDASNIMRAEVSELAMGVSSMALPTESPIATNTVQIPAVVASEVQGVPEPAPCQTQTSQPMTEDERANLRVACINQLGSWVEALRLSSWSSKSQWAVEDDELGCGTSDALQACQIKYTDDATKIADGVCMEEVGGTKKCWALLNNQHGYKDYFACQSAYANDQTISSLCSFAGAQEPSTAASEHVATKSAEKASPTEVARYVSVFGLKIHDTPTNRVIIVIGCILATLFVVRFWKKHEQVVLDKHRQWEHLHAKGCMHGYGFGKKAQGATDNCKKYATDVVPVHRGKRESGLCPTINYQEELPERIQTNRVLAAFFSKFNTPQGEERSTIGLEAMAGLKTKVIDLRVNDRNARKGDKAARSGSYVYKPSRLMPWEAFDDPSMDPVIWKMIVGNESWEADMCCGVAIVRAGCALDLHHHRAPEVYCIVHGSGSMQIGTNVVEANPGMMFYINGNKQHLTRASEVEDLVFVFFFPYDPFDEIEYHHHVNPDTGGLYVHPEGPLQNTDDGSFHKAKLRSHFEGLGKSTSLTFPPPVKNAYNVSHLQVDRKANTGMKASKSGVEDDELGDYGVMTVTLEPGGSLFLNKSNHVHMVYIVGSAGNHLVGVGNIDQQGPVKVELHNDDGVHKTFYMERHSAANFPKSVDSAEGAADAIPSYDITLVNESDEKCFLVVIREDVEKLWAKAKMALKSVKAVSALA